jgi:hypothetical protein
MKHRGLPSSVRVTAMVVLTAWMTSVALCSVECQRGRCHSEAAEVEYQTSDSHEQHHPPSPGHAPNSCPDKQTPCSALASTTLPDTFNYAPPPEYVIAVLFDHHFSPKLPHKHLFIEILRDSRRCDLVFTPEVCLGPAFRSLAPPQA